jgi:hypothetical protein
MSTFQKLVAGAIAIGLLTTAVLPKRKTSTVINAAGSATSNVFSTVMGTSTPAGAKATGV